MKIRHLFIFVMALAIAALGTSCNKNSEKNFYGKWDLSQVQYRDTDNEDWSDTITTEDENVSIEFQSDGTYSIYKDGAVEETGRWDYHDDYLYLRSEITVKNYSVEKCTKKEMEWYSRNEMWDEGQLNYWREQRWIWTKN